jgi:hypothetical protein
MNEKSQIHESNHHSMNGKFLFTTIHSYSMNEKSLIHESNHHSMNRTFSFTTSHSHSFDCEWN